MWELITYFLTLEVQLKFYGDKLRLFFHKTDSKAKMTRYLDLWSRHLNLFKGYLVQFTFDNMTRHADRITSNHIQLSFKPTS